MDTNEFYAAINRIAHDVEQVNRTVRRQYTEDDLEKVRSNIKKYQEQARILYRKLKLGEPCKQESEYNGINGICHKINEMRRNKADNFNSEFSTLLKAYNKLEYSIQTAGNDIITDARLKDDNLAVIMLCKNVRILEDLVNKICSNNIDKSIIGGEKHFDSIRYGFQWLFCHNDIDKNPSYVRVDIRDRNRYLDYVKYHIMVSSKYANEAPRMTSDVDWYYQQIQVAFDLRRFDAKTKFITNYKAAVTSLIEGFFQAYELLIKYRDALFAEEEIRSRLNRSSDGFTVITDEITKLSAVSVRVLLDRFVSFVKINDLNFGNSMFDHSWFNYSELSNSNYAGSSFKGARIENAKVRNSDLSTSNFALADCSGTDFSNSCFDYSNLTGIDLVDANISYCQFQNTIFRDTNLDSYQSAIKESWKKVNTNLDARIAKLLDYWGASSKYENYIEGMIEFFANIELPDIDNAEQMPVAILKCVPQDLKNKLGTNIHNLICDKIKKHISAELLNAVCNQLLPNEGAIRDDREGANGKVRFETANLTNVTAKFAQMSGCDFCHISMPQASFENADISGVDMYYTAAGKASFIYSNLNEADCFESDFSSSNFSNAVANNTTFINCNLENSNWTKAILIGATFVDVSDYVDVDILEKDIEMSLRLDQCFNFGGQVGEDQGQRLIADSPVAANMQKTNDRAFWQSNCNMNSAMLNRILADNIVFINIVADRSSFKEASLKNAMLANCKMHLSDFIMADLRYARIVCCSMSHSNFSFANMTMAKIHFVDFYDANLSKALFNLSEINHVLIETADLTELNLSGAQISNSAFVNCKFNSVNVSNAVFRNCIFSNITFSNLIGSHSCKFESCYAFECSADCNPNGDLRNDIPNGSLHPYQVFPTQEIKN